MISLDTDDDKDEFNIAASKNLSHLFEDDSFQTIEKSKSSLLYKPKQNKKPEPEPQPTKSRSSSLTPGKLNAFCASAVDVHKLDSGKYIYAGKLGIALMGNDLDVSYRIILYTAKNQPVSSATITEGFRFICQANNYCTYYDDTRQNWSILFPNSFDQLTFCRNIAHCLFGVTAKKNPTPVITQNLGLVSNESIPALTNHVVSYQIKVHGFSLNESLFENAQPKVLFEEQVNEKQVTGDLNPILVQLLSNMSPGNSRYLVTCPQKFTELTGIFSDSTKVPDVSKFWKIDLLVVMNSILTTDEWEATHKKVHKEAKSNPEPKAEAQTDDLDSPTAPEQSAPVPTAQKSTVPTDLAARMAKIGALPIFPLAQGPKTEDSKKSMHSKDSTDPKTAFQAAKTEPGTHTESQEIEQNREEPKKSPKPLNLVSLNAQNLGIPSSDKVYLDNKFNLLRTDLLEVKSLLLNHATKHLTPQTSNLTMDSTILLNSIQKIIEENAQLKSDLNDRSKDLEKMNNKFIELAGTKRDPERSPENPEETLKLKTEILNLKEQISVLKEAKYQLSMENLSLEKKIIESEKEATELSHRLSAASRQFKSSLKQTLNVIYQEFNQTIESQADSAEINASEVLSQVLIRVKKQQELRVRELAGARSSSAGSRRSSVASDSGHGSKEVVIDGEDRENNSL